MGLRYVYPTNGLVCSADDGGGGGGGGEGDPAFSESQKQEMIRMQNAANSAHHTRNQKVMDQKLAELQENMTASFTEMLSKFKPSDVGGQGGGGTNGHNGAGGDDDATAKVRAEYDARMSEMEKKFAAEKTARQEERDRNQRNEERGKLGSALRTAGVEEAKVRGAVALLYTEDQRVGRNKEGGIVFKVQRDGYMDELEMDAGVEEWMKSTEGKHFAPARDVRGSGASGGRAPAGGKGKQTRLEIKHELVRAVLGAAVNS